MWAPCRSSRLGAGDFRSCEDCPSAGTSTQSIAALPQPWCTGKVDVNRRAKLTPDWSAPLFAGTVLGLEAVDQIDDVEEESACSTTDEGAGDRDRQMR